MIRILLLLLWAGLPMLAWSSCRDTYTLFVAKAGYFYFQQDGKDAGMLPDLAHELELESGCQLRIAEIPFRRINAYRQQMRWALRGPVALGNHLSEIGPDEVPLLRDPPRFIAPKGMVWYGLDGMLRDSRARLGLVSGASYGAWWDKRLAQLPDRRKENFDTTQAILHKLMSGWLGATLGNMSIISKDIADLKLERAVAFHDAPEAPTEYLGVDIKGVAVDPQDQARLRQSLLVIRDDGRWERIVARYLGAREARRLVFHALSAKARRQGSE